MRKSRWLFVLAGVGLAITAGARLPVERDIAKYPELSNRFGYRVVRVAAIAEDTTRVRLNHSAHRGLTEEATYDRARQVAEVLRAADPKLADQALVVELSWTWRSDLVSRRTTVEHVFPRMADS